MLELKSASEQSFGLLCRFSHCDQLPHLVKRSIRIKNESTSNRVESDSLYKCPLTISEMITDITSRDMQS
jgi:hypothetical protein